MHISEIEHCNQRQVITFYICVCASAYISHAVFLPSCGAHIYLYIEKNGIYVFEKINSDTVALYDLARQLLSKDVTCCSCLCFYIPQRICIRIKFNYFPTEPNIYLVSLSCTLEDKLLSHFFTRKIFPIIFEFRWAQMFT